MYFLNYDIKYTAIPLGKVKSKGKLIVIYRAYRAELGYNTRPFMYLCS